MVFLGNCDLSDRQLNPKTANQWLLKIERERGRILRIKGCECFVRGGPHRREIDAIVAAAFWRQTFQSTGRGEICGLNRAGGAAEKARRRCLDSFIVTLGAELWIVSAVNSE